MLEDAHYKQKANGEFEQDAQGKKIIVDGLEADEKVIVSGLQRVREVGEGRSPPEGESDAERRRRGFGIARSIRAPAFRKKLLEPTRIELLRVDETAEGVRRGVGKHAVAEVEHVARAAGRSSQHVTRGFLHDVERRQ